MGMESPEQGVADNEVVEAEFTGEAFVPEDKLREFYQAEGTANEQAVKMDEANAEAASNNKTAKNAGQLAAALGGAGVAAMAAGVVMPGSGVFTAGMLGVGMGGQALMLNRRSKREAEENTEVAQEAESKRNAAFDITRGIVADQMYSEGATYDKDGLLTATPEQIELARKEMENDIV